MTGRRTISPEELREIVAEHEHWLETDGRDGRCACLCGQELRKAALSGTNLGKAVLSGADLTGADLSFAHLQDSDLSAAVLDHAKLQGAFQRQRSHQRRPRRRSRTVGRMPCRSRPHRDPVALVCGSAQSPLACWRDVETRARNLQHPARAQYASMMRAFLGNAA